MAGGNFMHRVISYVVNELVVDRLANSNLWRLLSRAAGTALFPSVSGAPIFANLLIVISSSVVQHVMHYGLRSPAFQRFAVRTSKKMEDISSMAAKKREELAEQMKEISKNIESKHW